MSVVDQGMGISVSDQSRLFNDFVQIRPGQLQKGKGSGLGLAISKKIVLLHKVCMYVCKYKEDTSPKNMCYKECMYVCMYIRVANNTIYIRTSVKSCFIVILQGNIGVNSKEGQGSTFYFSIPFQVGSFF